MELDVEYHLRSDGEITLLGAGSSQLAVLINYAGLPDFWPELNAVVVAKIREYEAGREAREG